MLLAIPPRKNQPLPVPPPQYSYLSPSLHEMSCFASSNGVQPWLMMKLNTFDSAKGHFPTFWRALPQNILMGASPQTHFAIDTFRKKENTFPFIAISTFNVKSSSFQMDFFICASSVQLVILFLFGTFSLGLGKVWSLCTLGQGRKYQFLPRKSGKVWELYSCVCCVASSLGFQQRNKI